MLHSLKDVPHYAKTQFTNPHASNDFFSLGDGVFVCAQGTQIKFWQYQKQTDKNGESTGKYTVRESIRAKK